MLIGSFSKHNSVKWKLELKSTIGSIPWKLYNGLNASSKICSDYSLTVFRILSSYIFYLLV